MAMLKLDVPVNLQSLVLDIPQEGVSASITQTWTDQALKCHLSGSDCANCSIPRGNYSFVCQMDKVVAVLLKTIGEPDPVRVQKFLPVMHHY